LFDETWRLERATATAAPTLVRAGAAPPPGQAPSLPVVEADGFVWAWPGVGAPPPSLPTFAAPPPGYTVHAELTMDVPVDAGLLLENLLDLAHAPFTHTSTFARGWPVPDAVKFRAAAALAGAWDPYPIDMAHAPPTGVISRVGLTQPGAVDRRGGTAAACARHLHQLHCVLPAGRGRVRLLYRMCLDFWPWAARLPGASALWGAVAGRVMGEDLVLVAGQQDRLARGGDAWAHPAPYDKLAVRARRWRNAVAAAGGPLATGEEEGGAGEGGGDVRWVASGELLFGDSE
jgi:chlorophyllide a oxygenase